MFCITLPTASGVANAAEAPEHSVPPSFAPRRMLDMRPGERDDDRGPDTERPGVLERGEQAPDTERPGPPELENAADTEPPTSLDPDSAPDTERPGPPDLDDEDVLSSSENPAAGPSSKPPRP
jgi:hypothetical protein